MRGLLVVTCLVAHAAALVPAPSIRARARAASRRSSPSMSIVVFGATGLTGKEAVWQALAKGEDVVAFCRNSAGLTKPAGSCGEAAAEQPIADDKLVTVTGTVTSQADVDKAFAAAPSPVTGVVVALGGKTADVGETMLTDGTKCVIEAMKKNSVKRVSVVTSIGAGDSENQAPFFFKVLMWTAMKKIFTDKNNQEALFLGGAAAPGAELEFTIVRPGGLNVEPPTGVINVIDGEAGSIPRADVADFCLGAVMDTDFPYLQKAPCISSVGGTSWVKDRSAKARGGTEAEMQA